MNDEHIANEAVSFILPLKDEDLNHLGYRSKFISINR